MSKKLVKEYLTDGCVFVQGDYCVDMDGWIYGGIGDGMVRCIARGDDYWNEDKVTNFTWRNSTGTPPTYTNLVEVKQRDGLVYVDYVINIDFGLELSHDDVIQWKPYIECELDWVLGVPNRFTKYFTVDWVYSPNTSSYYISKLT